MLTCRYKYSNGESCTEYSDGKFCNKHKDTFQARNFRRIIDVSQMTVMLYNNEAVFMLNGSKSSPLGEKEILFLEGRGIKVNEQVKKLVTLPVEVDNEISLNDTFVEF